MNSKLIIEGGWEASELAETFGLLEQEFNKLYLQLKHLVPNRNMRSSKYEPTDWKWGATVDYGGFKIEITYSPDKPSTDTWGPTLAFVYVGLRHSGEIHVNGIWKNDLGRETIIPKAEFKDPNTANRVFQAIGRVEQVFWEVEGHS